MQNITSHSLYCFFIKKALTIIIILNTFNCINGSRYTDMEKKYLNNQVAQITGITNRQVISWTEKGLVIPYEESTGVGKKRIYDYKNLLEFALCDVLLNNAGIGFRSVKRIIKHLRDQGILAAWANNFAEYYKEQINKTKKILKSINYDGELPPIQPEKIGGLLAYFVGIEYEDIYLLPWDFENAVNLNLFKDAYKKSFFSFFINIGKIKGTIDKRI